MVPTERPVVEILGGADRVAMVPPKFEATPAATQLAVVTHDTPERDPTPDGGAMEVQDAPPLVVLMMLVPPTAVHVDALMQLTESQGGRTGWSSKVVPLRAAVVGADRVGSGRQTGRGGRTRDAVEDAPGRGSLRDPGSAPVSGAEDRCSGAAGGGTDGSAMRRIRAGDSGEIADCRREALGGPRLPPSVVTMMLGEGGEPKSLTAWQVEALTHKRPRSRRRLQVGWSSGVQVRPPSVVANGGRAPKDAESDGRAVAGCRTRDPVQAADLGRNDVRAPRISSVDGGQDRVDSHSEAVGGARTRDGVQTASRRAVDSASPTTIHQSSFP